jgi:hypothetical protein
MTSVFIPYEPMKNGFHMTIIAKLWPMKFVMLLYHHTSVGVGVGDNMVMHEKLA